MKSSRPPWRDGERIATPTPDDIKARAAEAAFGKPTVVNNLRALVVEMIIATALEPSWTWRASDWAGWDFEHGDGTRLEVKQSAARQTWAAPRKRPVSARFDIAPRTGHWKDGAEWIASAAPARQSNIYVFAYHGVEDNMADHRDPLQWVFYIVPTEQLTQARSIGLAGVRLLAQPVGYADLFAVVESTRLAATESPARS